MPVPSDQTSYLAYNSMLALDTGRFTTDLLFARVVNEFPPIKSRCPRTIDKLPFCWNALPSM